MSKRAEENPMTTKNPLDLIRISAPCGADWNEMRGTESRRFCTMCQLNVYNISNMTREEAEDLFLENEGRICVRLYRREDGTVITKNCPVGLKKLTQKVSRTATAAFGLFAGFVSGLFGFSSVNTPVGHAAEPEIASTEQRIAQRARVTSPTDDGAISFGGDVSNSFELQLAIRMTRKFPADRDD